MGFTEKWAKLAVLNFLILAAVGVTLRYKILFPLPWVDQKHLLHAHSHFAFAGWVSLSLYIAIIHILQPNTKDQQLFNRILWLHQLSSFGMLFTFPFMGYAAPSIAFSTLSILVSFWFSWKAWFMIRSNNSIQFQKKWFYTGIVANLISSLGTFSLAYLMANQILHQSWYFGSVYFYLHFQYNGWFLFTLVGLMLVFAAQKMNLAQIKISNYIFYLLVAAIIPAWFLSMLWMRVPNWMPIAGDLAAGIQLIAGGYMILLFLQLKSKLKAYTHPITQWLWLFSSIALILKIILQGFSAIPDLNQYAFGIRAIVVGFLHLVLLGFVSLCMLGYLIQTALIDLHTALAKKGIVLFVLGVFLNEIVLFAEGLAAIFATRIPYGNESLLVIACTMFLGLGLIVLAQKKEVPF